MSWKHIGGVVPQSAEEEVGGVHTLYMPVNRTCRDHLLVHWTFGCRHGASGKFAEKLDAARTFLNHNRVG